MKIYFRNSKNWSDPYAVLFNTDESVNTKIKLDLTDDGDFELEFDNARYDHLCFIGDEGEKTGKVYPGKLSIGVEYKQNDKMGRDLTYLYSKESNRSGKVESFELSDVINLAHRKDKSKKISVFLPESYDGKTPHDIMYFFDAQNLFCGAGDYTENGDPYGSWQLDIVINEFCRQYAKNMIVVGIENADEYRSNELFMDPELFGELSPLATTIPEDNFSKGYLDGLSTFMTHTLHSFIKENYCVDESNIGIGGSSMGGIAAFYCGLREMGFYKYVLSYSPAFGLYENSAFENYFARLGFEKNLSKLPHIHIYCGCGDQLEQSLMPSAVAMKDLLIKNGYSSELILQTFDKEKPHNEESWRLILPQSFNMILE